MHVRWSVAATLHVVAATALRRGHRKGAIRAWESALVLAGRPSGRLEARIAAHCLAGLSAAEIQAGRYDAAGTLAGRGLALIRDTSGRRERLVSAMLHNHAGVAARLAGRHEDARAHYERALEGYRASGRGRSASAAVVYHNRAGLAFAQGDLADAERLTLHAAWLNRRSPIRLAGDRGMLGVIVAARGRLAEGERLVRQALDTFLSRLGPDHREIAFALGNLAEIRRLQGAADEAHSMAVRARAVGERALGPTHPELAPILNTLALVRHESGDTRGARQLLERAVVLLDGAVASDMPASGVCTDNLARALATTVAQKERPLTRAHRTGGAGSWR